METCFTHELILLSLSLSHTHTHTFLRMVWYSPPTFAQWSKAIGVTVPELKKQIRRSQRAKAALIEANLRLVVTVARQAVKKARSEINFQDACQEGIIGLNRACEKFDPEKGKFVVLSSVIVPFLLYY